MRVNRRVVGKLRIVVARFRIPRVGVFIFWGKVSERF